MSMILTRPVTHFTVIYSIAPAATGDTQASATARWATYAASQSEALSAFAQRVESRYKPGQITVLDIQRYP